MAAALIVSLGATACKEKPGDETVAKESAEHVSIVPQLHPVQPRRVVFAPDKEERLLVLEASGLVGVWDVGDVAHPVRTAWIPAGAVDATFSADANEIVTAGWDGKVRWWSLGGRLLRTSKDGHQGWARALAVALWRGADSKRRIDDVVSGGEDGTLRIWGRDGTARGEPIPAHQGYVVSIAMRANGDLVSAGTDEAIRLWEKDPSSPAAYRARVLLQQERSKRKSQLEHLIKWDMNMGWDRAVAFSPGAGVLAAVNFDGGVRLWERGNWETAKIVHPPSNSLARTLAWTHSGDAVAVGRFNGKVLIWTARGMGRGEIAHSAPVMSVAFSQSGTRLATACNDNRVRLWNLDGTLLGELPVGSGFDAMAVALTEQGPRFATADASGRVQRWRIDGSPPLEDATGTPGRILALALSPSGESLVAGGGDGSVRLFERNGGGKAVAHRIGTYIDEAVFSPRGDVLAIAGDRKVEVLNADGSKRAEPFRACEKTILGIAISPVEDVAAILCENGPVTLWTLDGKERGPLFEPEIGEARGLAISPSAQLLASGSVDGFIRFWELPPRALDDRVHVGLPIDQVGLHPQGTWASAKRDTAVFYDRGGRTVATAVASPDGVVIFTPQGWFAGSPGAEKRVGAFRPDGSALSPAETAERLAPAKVSAALHTP